MFTMCIFLLSLQRIGYIVCVKGDQINLQTYRIIPRRDRVPCLTIPGSANEVWQENYIFRPNFVVFSLSNEMDEKLP